MQNLEFVRWRRDGFRFGYWLDCPDYWTRGTSIAVPNRHLEDLYADVEGGEIPGVPRVGGR